MLEWTWDEFSPLFPCLEVVLPTFTVGARLHAIRLNNELNAPD